MYSLLMSSTINALPMRLKNLHLWDSPKASTKIDFHRVSQLSNLDVLEFCRFDFVEDVIRLATRISTLTIYNSMLPDFDLYSLPKLEALSIIHCRKRGSIVVPSVKNLKVKEKEIFISKGRGRGIDIL